jgi:glc operon protein GlcG
MPFDIPYGTPLPLDQAQTAISAAMTEAAKHKWQMAIAGRRPRREPDRGGDDGRDPVRLNPNLPGKGSYRRNLPASDRHSPGGHQHRPGSCTRYAAELNRRRGKRRRFPIVIDGKLVGAIGAGGGMATQDGVTAKAGLGTLGVK